MENSRVKIGFLVPLNNSNKEENGSIPKLPVFEGLNIVGRDDISVSDKRVSRKHISLNVSVDGIINVVVDGSNPVVISSGEERKKLYPREKATIVDGDVVELIPGHHTFKYVVSPGERQGFSLRTEKKTEERNLHENEKQAVKRKRQLEDDETLARSLAVESDFASHQGLEAIRHFRVTKEKLPLTFQLLRVQGLPPWANSSAVSIEDVIQGNVTVAILSNYMVDMDWLISACPTLRKIPHVLVVHGEGDGRLHQLQKNKPANWTFHKPLLPISYGTHHSKAMFLVFPRGLRVVIHTSNLIHVDWNNKSQGLWMQDFPWKDKDDQSKGCGFEIDLIDYLSILKWPEFTVNIPGTGNVKINSSFFKKFDYSSAAVRLIASVPGYHVGPNLKKWGHLKLRTILQECVFGKEFQNSPLVYQFSSLGSLDEKWMVELASSMSAGFSDDKAPLGLGKPLIVWPTVEDVRCSLEGYAAGNAIPSPQKNVEKDFLKKYWAKWRADHTGRSRAMPHIKTYVRYNSQNLAWFILTSANLSKAAWGALQKNNSQLMIRSYELGVLFLPSSIKDGCGFSCTNDCNSAEVKPTESISNKEKQRQLATLCWQGNMTTRSSNGVIQLPVPYELPPQPYLPGDVPWSWDRQYSKKDVYGQVWPQRA